MSLQLLRGAFEFVFPFSLSPFRTRRQPGALMLCWRPIEVLLWPHHNLPVDLLKNTIKEFTEVKLGENHAVNVNFPTFPMYKAVWPLQPGSYRVALPASSKARSPQPFYPPR